MIKFSEIETHGWGAALRGMRNPMNSWDRADSVFCDSVTGCDVCAGGMFKLGDAPLMGKIGPNDQTLMMSLAKGGPVHAKYRRMIVLYLDIEAPLYWWKEFDTYKVGTVADSCSTMHKIHAKKFTRDDFSWEKLSARSIHALDETIRTLNYYRDAYLNLKEDEDFVDEDGQVLSKKDVWWQMIQLLPSSYNQRRTVMLSYEVLFNAYHSRKHHKLDEWREFCAMTHTLPYPEIFTLEEGKTANQARIEMGLAPVEVFSE